MHLSIKRRSGQGIIEYVTLVVFIIGALLVVQKYLSRGISGRWKASGDSFGSGRQFDPNKTTECGYDARFNTGWYDLKCYEKNCETTCLSLNGSAVTCRNCILGCQTTLCNTGGDPRTIPSPSGTPMCGDGICNGSEDCPSCPTDCGCPVPPPPPQNPIPQCPDGICNGTENCENCFQDCACPFGQACGASGTPGVCGAAISCTCTCANNPGRKL